MEPKDKKGDKESIYDIAKRSGYTVCFTQKDASALKEGDKAIVIAETLADSGAFSYEEDRKADEWALSDYVKKGIEVLDNPDGFFMMVEGGKIDWACHANDARSTIADTIALSDAVAEAVKFQQEHPSDTLILVTADHETGGLTIGYAGTDYNLFFRTLDNQTISYAKFDSDYVSRYKKDKTSFEDVMADVEKLFGLKKPGNAGSDKDGGLVLTDYEYGRIRTAYEKTMSGNKNRTQEAYELYGIYEPLTVTLTHVLNHKSGIGFTSYSHPGLPVPVQKVDQVAHGVRRRQRRPEGGVVVDPLIEHHAPAQIGDPEEGHGDGVRGLLGVGRVHPAGELQEEFLLIRVINIIVRTY